MKNNPNFFADSSSPEKSHKEKHHQRIDKLKFAYEQEMRLYIHKYILDGRCISEVFCVAHQSVVDDVFREGVAIGNSVLAHIICNEEEFLKTSMQKST